MRRLKLVSAIVAFVAILAGSVFSLVYFSKQKDEGRVVTTIFPVYDICRELLGSEEELVLLGGGGVDMHNYKLSIQDMATISECDLFIYVGGESEDWIDDVLKTSNASGINTCSLIDKVNAIEEHGHDDHEHESVYDEHIWLSIKNMIKMTDEIAKALILEFPEKESIISNNKSTYITELNLIDSAYSQVCLNNEKPIIVADRFPFNYLVHDYNMKYFSAFSACSTETDASFETMTMLIDAINVYSSDYIFVLENSTRNTANGIISSDNCREGVEILELNSLQALNKSQISSLSYIDIMNNNLENIKKAIG